jgi:NNP family nitrate/nitrite transporter-like MFS transporter
VRKVPRKPATADFFEGNLTMSATTTSGRQGRLLTIWAPEDKSFWEREGEAIAKRNLWISVPALFLAFAIWQVWSVVAVSLPGLGFKYSTNQLFWLAAAPALSGATLRIFYSFMVPLVGGRRWTAISTASLLIPAIGIGFAVQDNTTAYPTMLILALLCGLGGGNFSSSMANISFFFPKERKGSALGVNAGLGNLGVSVVQFLSPLVVTAGIFGIFGGEAQTIVKNGQTMQVWTQNAAFIWVPWIALTALAAWFGMNDIADAKASFAAQAAIFKRKHNWLMCVLYLGTFGSFIGYAAGFPLLIKSQFPNVNPLAYAWLGPLVGAVIRPFGGWLADKLGGARVTLWNFIVMAIAVMGVTVFLPSAGNEGQFGGFFVCFLVLFLTTGIGNGSTFRMIPVIFLTEAMRGVDKNNAAAVAQANKEGNTLGAATLGFTAAMAAYGGFFIPKSYGSSIALTGAPHAALWCFAAFYLVCIAVTWWYYARKHAEMPC